MPAGSRSWRLRPRRALAQGFAGLGADADNYAKVTPGQVFAFPADHGPHPDFRIEWWYVTANLVDANGAAYGAQWTLFRQAFAPGAREEGWANQQIWMAHAAVTRADTHRFSRDLRTRRRRAGRRRAKPFQACIDSWAMRGSGGSNANAVSPLELTASAKDFSYALKLEADRPLVLQGDGGYSRKSEREQASYYYSQPFFRASGRLTIDERPVDVTGLAWMDREWSSQPLAADQTRVGLVRAAFRFRREADAVPDAPDGRQRTTSPAPGSCRRQRTPARPPMHRHDADRDDRDRRSTGCPVEWYVTIASLKLAIHCAPLNREGLDGHGLRLLGRADPAFGGTPYRRWIS